MLNPLLFFIDINDLVIEIDPNFRIFADDTSIFMVVDNPVMSAEQLNADLVKILQWFETWLVSFNPL